MHRATPPQQIDPGLWSVMFHGEDQVQKALRYMPCTLCADAMRKGVDLACVTLVKSRGRDEYLSELHVQGNKEITIAN